MLFELEDAASAQRFARITNLTTMQLSAENSDLLLLLVRYEHTWLLQTAFIQLGNEWIFKYYQLSSGTDNDLFFLI
jgi:hypothetical protein